MKKIFLLLATILLVFSLFVRTNGLLNYPPSLFSDEVDAGYQAFVFNACGNDYFGNKWPIHFHSFADWRTSVFVYTIALIQRIVGATDLSVRLPNVIIGFAGTVVFGLLIHYVFKNKWLGLMGAAIMTVNPWFFHYGREGWEVVGMITSLLAAIYLWLIYLDKKKFGYLAGSLVFWALSFYCYATAKLFIVLIGLAIILVWKDRLFKLRLSHVIGGILLFVLISMPMLLDMINGKAGYRFSYINIFSDPTISDNVNRARYEDALSDFKPGTVGTSPSWETKIIYNKATLVAGKFITNYVNSFSTDFLYTTGDGNLRQGFGQKGVLYLTDMIFLIIGAGVAIAGALTNGGEEKETRMSNFMLWFLALSPIPFALTRDSAFPSGTRLLLMIIPIMYFVVLGIYRLFLSIRLETKTKAVLVGVILLGLYGVQYGDFWHYYRYHYPQISAREWHYGMKDAVLASVKSDAEKIYYSSTYEPFLPFFYFYTHYLPSDKSCAPALATTWDNTEYFTGMQAEHKYYFGFVDWSVLFSKNIDLNKAVFVVPETEYTRIQNLMSADATVKARQMKLEVLYDPEKKYTEQTKMYIIRINSEKTKS